MRLRGPCVSCCPRCPPSVRASQSAASKLPRSFHRRAETRAQEDRQSFPGTGCSPIKVRLSPGTLIVVAARVSPETGGTPGRGAHEGGRRAQSVLMFHVIQRKLGDIEQAD
jgi:hypothetical protein